jgi:hypothetical protein
MGDGPITMIVFVGRRIGKAGGQAGLIMAHLPGFTIPRTKGTCPRFKGKTWFNLIKDNCQGAAGLENKTDPDNLTSNNNPAKLSFVFAW